jgi:hypothetical protein
MFSLFRRFIAFRRKALPAPQRAPRPTVLPTLEALEDRMVLSGFVPGSINAQDGWSGGNLGPIDPSVDQAVVQSGGNAFAGVGAWRVSNSTAFGNHNGAFNGWPFSPGLSVVAGQPSSGAGADQFNATFYFKSASTVADGSNIEVDLGDSAGDDRTNFLAITNKADADGGLQLRAAEPDGATGNFFPTVSIATNLSRTAYHRIDVVARFFDGPANDTFQVSLDGVVLTNPRTGGTTFGTFEGYRNGLGTPYAETNRLFWRSGGAPSAYGAFADNAAQGFYFDDVNYQASKQSNPNVALASYSATFERIAIDPATLLPGQVGTAYNQSLTGSSGQSPYTFTVSSGALPPGLTLTSNGSITGTPTTAGAFSFTVTATDSTSPTPFTDGQTYTLFVNPAPATSSPSTPSTSSTTPGGALVLGQNGLLWLEAPNWLQTGVRTLVDANVKSFAASTDGTVFVLGTNDMLWQEAANWTTTGTRNLVDGNVQSFALGSNGAVFVLGENGALWQETATWVKTGARTQIDVGIAQFAVGAGNVVYVVDLKGNLNFESASGPVFVDSNVRSFQVTPAGAVIVLGLDGNLWSESPGWQQTGRTFIDGGVKAFAQAGNGQLFVLGTNGNLWQEAPGWQQTGTRALVDSTVAAIAAGASPGQVFVQGQNGFLFLEAAGWQTAGRTLFDSGVKDFAHD